MFERMFSGDDVSRFLRVCLFMIGTTFKMVGGQETHNVTVSDVFEAESQKHPA